MYYTAFVNTTDKVIIAEEQFKTKEDAAYRVQFGYTPQWDAEDAGQGCYGGPEKKFEIYGPAEVPFAWPVEEPIE